MVKNEMKMLSKAHGNDVGTPAPLSEESSPKKKGNKNEVNDLKAGVTFDSNGKVLLINKKPKIGVGKYEPVRTETNV